MTTTTMKKLDAEIWDAVNGLVFVNKQKEVEQRISIDTINGSSVRSFYRSQHSEKVAEIFPNGLPKGIDFVFVSVAA